MVKAKYIKITYGCIRCQIANNPNLNGTPIPIINVNHSMRFNSFVQIWVSREIAVGANNWIVCSLDERPKTINSVIKLVIS